MTASMSLSEVVASVRRMPAGAPRMKFSGENVWLFGLYQDSVNTNAIRWSTCAISTVRATERSLLWSRWVDVEPR